MSMRRSHGRALFFLALVAALSLAVAAAASPGGGDDFGDEDEGSSGGGASGGGGGSNFSGGGGGSDFSGSGGGGGGGSVGLGRGLMVAIPWGIFGILVVALVSASNRKNRAWTAGAAQRNAEADRAIAAMGLAPRARHPAVMQMLNAQRAQRGLPLLLNTQPHPQVPRRALEALRATDPNFSVVLFEDFLYSLYAEVHTARGEGRVAQLSAYLAPEVLTILSQAQRGPVTRIVIGAMHYLSPPWWSAKPDEDLITAEIEANYTETNARETRPAAEGVEGAQRYFIRERWTLARKRGALSRTPDRAKVFGCPSCGAPQGSVIAGTCQYCSKIVATGEFDWVVRNVELVTRKPRSPVPSGDSKDRGMDKLTVLDADVQARATALQQRDPAFNWPQLQQRVGLIFNEFNVAWSARDLAKMRPYMSDLLFSSQGHWIQNFNELHMRNVMENARLTNVELARVTSDRFYDALTVRISAVALDYTIADDGRLVAGNRTQERRYSEYWTLIRGVNRSGPTRTTPACPSCGAQLNINMAGDCAYCNAKVTTGDFDWVLSRIEQVSVYSG